ncbi:MAG: hypothetical protein ACJAUG_002072, partial [Halioglobus sp.]
MNSAEPKKTNHYNPSAENLKSLLIM